MQPGDEQFVLKVPNNAVALIIGKGGEAIKYMQTKSGSRIRIVPLHLPSGDKSTERSVYINGGKEQIELAKELINKVISWKSSSNAYGTNSHMQKSSYPNEKVTKARDNSNSQTVYSLGDICQICSQFGYIALSCSQRPSPRQVLAIGCSLQCQICLKTDHSAAECLHRHHYDFQPSIQEEPQTMIASSPIQSTTRSIPIESTLLSSNSSAKDNALCSATSVSSKISGWQHKMLKELAALSIQDTWLQQSALPCRPLMNCREICHERGMLQSELIPPG
ncbi:hypothetical protein ACLB2K_046681 [Fragaria x ananassa]